MSMFDYVLDRTLAKQRGERPYFIDLDAERPAAVRKAAAGDVRSAASAARAANERLFKMTGMFDPQLARVAAGGTKNLEDRRAAQHFFAGQPGEPEPASAPLERLAARQAALERQLEGAPGRQDLRRELQIVKLAIARGGR